MCTKKINIKKTGIELKLEEYIKSDYHRNEMYEKNDIQIIDLNEDEIETEVKNFIEEEKNNKIKIREIEKSRQFIFKLLKSKKLRIEDTYIHPECRVSSLWIDRIK